MGDSLVVNARGLLRSRGEADHLSKDQASLNELAQGIVFARGSLTTDGTVHVPVQGKPSNGSVLVDVGEKLVKLRRQWVSYGYTMTEY